MNYRPFGNTELSVSEIGFGAWAIGGPAQVGSITIGWGNSDDQISKQAIHAALDQGINFFDTADFYGLGHSEEILGQFLEDQKEVLIATKVGQKQSPDHRILVDYSYSYILQACEASLRRLRRDHIDFYQLHTAKVKDLENGEAIRALEKLKDDGKIRYWGVSVNTFNPEPESHLMLEQDLGHGVQLVFNVINQKALPLVLRFAEKGFGIIARMPLQFGLLANKFTAATTFPPNDHRSFRLTPEIIERSNSELQPLWTMADRYHTDPVGISLSYILSYPGISTVIPGIRTPEQAIANTQGIVSLTKEDRSLLEKLYKDSLIELVSMMQKAG